MAGIVDAVEPGESVDLIAGEQESGQRLDRWLAGELLEHSRSEIQRWIEDGRVLVNGKTGKASYRLERGDQIEVAVPPVEKVDTLKPAAIPLNILYEDDDLLVIDKHAGMVVHPAPGHTQETLVNAVLHHCPQIAGVGPADGPVRPGIVHRLDKGTSGLIVVAKHDRAHRALQAQFQPHPWDEPTTTRSLAQSSQSPEALPAVKLLFLTSPNNPTGNWLPDEDLVRLLELPVLVVLDEAYVEFADHPSRAEWVLRHENLVILRTFSKAAGIAGLRLGYGICPLWLMEQLWKFKQPYNVNVAATVAGLASLQHVDQITAVVGRIKDERSRLLARLQTVDYLRAYPSQGNFILCDVIGRNAKELKLALEQRGILVRHYNKPGLQNCIRISVGRPEQTDRLLEVLQMV